jgi:hypothetical protein
LFSVTNGNFNTAVGAGSLDLNTADNNTAFGAAALLFNTTGFDNTAVGTAALENNTGNQNTALGALALFNNNATNNCAVGFRALTNNDTGIENTATGSIALFNNFTGERNTATGAGALFLNTQGDGNTANGSQALVNNTGNNNTATGLDALGSNDIGSFNTATGDSALGNNTTGSFNTALGKGAGLGVTTAAGVICIGTDGANVNTSCFIGNIRGVTTQNANAIPVLIDSAGQLGTMSSSRRFKKEIKSMDKASESILALKPVTFHYKSDKTDTPQFGLIAEEVAAVNPDLVVCDKNGEIYTVRYDAVNAMLLNEFLKEHRKVEQLTKEFQTTVAQQQKQIEALTTGLQKVNAQLEASKPAPQVAENNQ